MGTRRHPDDVKPINMRMTKVHVDELDTLCETNNRSRREIVEILVHEAALELKQNPQARITPLK